MSDVIENENAPVVKKKEKYLTNPKLREQLRLYGETGIISSELHLMMMLLSKKIINKPNWCAYTWREDMISDAYLKCLEVLHKYDTTRQNPFAYFTSVVSNFYKDYIKFEKKQGKIKQQKLIQHEAEQYIQHGILSKNSVLDNDERGN